MGFVYFIENQEGLIKIGISVDVQSRLTQLQTRSSQTLELKSVIESEDYKTIEEELHWHFKEKRIRGEWFSLTDDELNHALNWYQNWEKWNQKTHEQSYTHGDWVLFELRCSEGSYAVTHTITYDSCSPTVVNVISISIGKGVTYIDSIENESPLDFLDKVFEGSSAVKILTNNFNEWQKNMFEQYGEWANLIVPKVFKLFESDKVKIT